LDLRSASSIRNALASTKPATIINLAAIADPRQANADPELAYDVNVVGQLRLILGMRDIIPHARLLVVGSALEYGRDSSGRILSEDDPLRPEGVYAVTKAAADLQAYQHHLSDGLDIIRVRPFNIIGPGRPEAYFPAPQIRQVAEILDHGAPPIIRTLGLSDALDFVDVRDAASALQVLVARGTTGEAYNVASGRVTPLRTVVDRLVSIADLKVEVIEDRTASQSKGWIVAGDPSKIARDTGWCPARSLDESLRDSLNHVREQLASRIPTAV
jgi:GDP-4-dehydro-6-deoxy-D-mannose reductase